MSDAHDTKQAMSLAEQVAKALVAGYWRAPTEAQSMGGAGAAAAVALKPIFDALDLGTSATCLDVVQAIGRVVAKRDEAQSLASRHRARRDEAVADLDTIRGALATLDALRGMSTAELLRMLAETRDTIDHATLRREAEAAPQRVRGGGDD